MTNEVKNIPELRFSGFEGEWEEKLIKDILEFENNRRKPVTSTSREIGNYPYYGASGIIDYVKDYIFNNERRLLIGEDGAKWGSFEESSFIATGRYWVNNHAHVAKSELNNLIFLNNSLNYKELRTYVTGNAPAKLTYNNLCNIPVLLPSIEEQNKIGNFFIKLDRQIELEQKKLELLEQQKHGYMQKIFSQQLRFKDENGKDYPAWEIKKLGDLYKYQQGQQIPVENQYKIQTNNMKRFIRIVDVTENPKKRYIKDRKESGLINQKDLIMIRYRASAGTISMGYEGVIANNLFKFVKKQNVDNRYFYFLLKKNHFKIKSLSSQSAMPALNFNAMDTLKFSIPQYSEQQKIGGFFSELDKLVEKQNQKIDGLKERKKGFLQKMFV